MVQDFKEKQQVAGLSFAVFVAKTFFILVFIQMLSFLTSIMTARLLGPAGKGVVAIIILYPTLLFAIGHLSLNRALIGHVGVKRFPLEAYCGSLAFFVIVVNVILIASFLFVFKHYNSIFIKDVRFSILALSLAMLPFFFIQQIYSGILQVQEKIDEINVILFVQTAAVLVSLSFLFFFGKIGIPQVVFSFFFANLMAAILAVYYVVRIIPTPWSVNFGLLKELLLDGIKLHLGVIATFLFLKIDQLMLNHYKPAASVGYYAIAVSFSELLLLIPFAIQNVFYAKIPRMTAEKADMAGKTILIYKHNLILLSFFAVFLAFIAKAAIRFFYGNAFLPSLAPFLMLLPGAFFLYLNNVLTNYLIGTRHFLTVTFISSCAALLNIFLNTIFIPRFDAWGAALSSTITYILMGGAILVVFLRINRYSPLIFVKNLFFSPSDFMLYRVFLNQIVARVQKR